VKNLEDIRLIQLRVNRSGLDLFSQGDESLPASLRATADNLGGTYVELVLRPELHSKGTLGQRALDWVRGLAGDQRTKEGADVFKVRGLDRRTSQVELVDLLKDQLVSTRTVAQQDRRHRGVDAWSM